MKNASHPQAQYRPKFIRALAWYAVIGCIIFAVSILIADVVVPNHDWIADTISDLGAGRYEFIVDIGIYAFSSALIAMALLAAHIHLGTWDWALATVGLAVLGLIVFLIGARNEYGDNDNDGVVIHIYLVYVLGVLFLAVPSLLARGAARIDRRFSRMLVGVTAVWAVSAPVFFFLPDSIDGIYERYLGLIAFALVFILSRLFLRCAEPS